MEKRSLISLVSFAILFTITGCANHQTHGVRTTPIFQAQTKIPEDQLLDVGIAAFESVELTAEKAMQEGTHPNIRKAESHFLPYHLKYTLQHSSHWGAVRVVPKDTEEGDLLVKGEIIESNGENLLVKVVVSDAAGNVWLQKKYKAQATNSAYTANVPGKKDAFQDLYNTITNDIIAYKQQLSSTEVKKIRTIATLKFAKDFAADAFNDYVTTNENAEIVIKRLPADDDPMMARVLRIRERNYMFLDTLNEYYDWYYNEMWSSYEEWRKANLVERLALKEVRRQVLIHQIGDILLTAVAASFYVFGVNKRNLSEGIMLLSDGKIFIDGINISKQADIHSLAIQELSELFDAEMKPLVVALEDKQYELSGSAEEQYARWRELLKDLYYAETGFEPTQ